MIFVTVGTQLGFDRLIRAMDELTPELSEEILAQTGVGSFAPQNMTFQERFTPSEIGPIFERARLIVGHVGIGTVLAAQRHGKPIILFPRHAVLGEHRNDHQLATARQLQGRPGIRIAFETQELREAVLQSAMIEPPSQTPSPENSKLKQTIAIFMENGSLAP